jgi:hypothetical protein
LIIQGATITNDSAPTTKTGFSFRARIAIHKSAKGRMVNAVYFAAYA